VSKVILINPKGQEKEFSKEHAERLLSMTNNGGWKKKRIAKKDNGSKSDTGITTAADAEK
jgi:hypothetical protein